MKKPVPHYAFDKRYYQDFYSYPRLRKSDQREVELLGNFVCAYLSYLGLPVRRAVDLGCGFGLFRQVLARHFPKARYTGVEISEFLCREYGWTQGSVVDFRARAPFDLVICKDVLQYLPHAEAAAAIDNLAGLCGGALCFNALTREDWEENCDQEATNGDVYLRSSSWYRQRLRRHFTPVGGGVFVHRRAQVVLWELEKLG